MPKSSDQKNAINVDHSPIVQWLSVGFDFLRIGFFNSNTYIIAGNITNTGNNISR